MALTIVSSVRNHAVRPGLACFGEAGLASEIRAVPRPGPRLAEAAKVGFTDVLVPAGNLDHLDESERKYKRSGPWMKPSNSPSPMSSADL